MAYQHTQSNRALSTVMLVATVGTFIRALVMGQRALFSIPATLAPVMLVVYAFSSLTVKVNDDTVEARFRWGWPRETIARDRVLKAEQVRNKWWYGWGLRVIPEGRMFNVWGLDAVHLELEGRRGFRIGTDDPQGLLAAVNASSGGTRPHSR